MNGELPKGWSTCSVGDIFRSFSGGTPARGTRAYWGGTIPWLSSGDIKTERIREASETITKIGLANSSASLCRPGSVVVVVRSGILKHTLPVAVLDREAAINQDIKCFDAGDDELNEWLALALRASARDILTLNREGTTVQSVKYETLKDFTLPVPPRAEQRRIVAALEVLLLKVGDSRKRLDLIPTILKRFRQSVLAAAFSGRLTTDREEKRNSDDEWREHNLGDFCLESFYGPRFGRDEYVPTGIPTIRTTDFTDAGEIVLRNAPMVRIPRDKREKFLLRQGDLLVTRTGSIGKMAVFLGGYDAMPSAYLIRFRFSAKLLPKFAFYCLSSPRWQQMLGLGATAVTQPNINAETIKALPLPCPPLPEQEEVVRRVEALLRIADRLESRYQEANKKVDSLTQSILAKAFRGELVPQDPKDEPASLSLERIASHHDGGKTSRKRKQGGP